MAKPRFQRLRYWLWWRLAERPGICPATSHGRIIYGDREARMGIEPNCLYEDESLGCWCGKVRSTERDSVLARDAARDGSKTVVSGRQLQDGSG